MIDDQEGPASPDDQTSARSFSPQDATNAVIKPKGAGAVTPSAAPPGDSRERHVLRDRYQLEDLIGQGAMGEVWRARDLMAVQAADRNPYVAIKLLNVKLSGSAEAAVALFIETSRGQKLAHPNITTAYHFDRDGRTGKSFMVMELLEGKPLDQLIREVADSGMTPDKALPLIRDMAHGLAYAHRKGLVHSDIKPSNIFVTTDGTAKVLDFGIARVSRAEFENSAQPLADDSVFTGYTATYASPEAILKKEPYPADDVFSLGVVAYQLLAGYHPFDRKNSTKAAEEGLEPKPIKGLKQREWAAIKKSLAFERANRFADAGEFARALDGVGQLYPAFAGVAALSLAAAGFFWYQRNQATDEVQPLPELPAIVQIQVRDALREGTLSLERVASAGDITASADAAQYFAEAYALHPRDSDAVAGLEKSADLVIDWYSRQPDRAQAAEELRKFQAKSEFYRTYRPLLQAIEGLEGS